MSKQTSKLVHIVAIFPFFATGMVSPLLPPSTAVSSTRAYLILPEESAEQVWEKEAREEREERIAKINAFFASRNMPLAGTGKAMIAAAQENDLDWRLLPAIAVRESSGGKQMCGANPFGWASCKISFKNIGEGIEVVARNLGGNNPNTAHYYSGDTREKLHYYNGTVIPTYTDEIFAIMGMIERQEVE